MSAPFESFQLSTEEATIGLKPPIVDLLASELYENVSRQSAELIANGSPEAMFSPFVKVILDSALNTLTLPTVQERLPKEVVERRTIGAYCAQYATNLLLHFDLPTKYFGSHYALFPLLLLPNSAKNLRNKEYLTNLGSAPFSDVSIVAGGALRAIRSQTELTESPANVIAGSRGLLAVSGVYKGNVQEAVRYLGIPYATADHFMLYDDPKGLRVGFVDETKSFLQNLYVPGRGCPAGKMRADNGEQSMLSEYWERLVDYLIPADATTDQPNRVPDPPHSNQF